VNWGSGLFVMTGVLVLYAALARNAQYALGASVTAGLASVVTAGVRIPALTWTTQFGMVTGASVLVTSCVFRQKTPRWAMMLGALLLTAATYDAVDRTVLTLYSRLLVSLGLSLLGMLAWIRTRDMIMLAVTVSPIVYWCYQIFRTREGWFFVILSFFLLSVGAVVSIRKKRTLAAACGA